MAEMPPPPAREGDFRDLRAVMGVDDAVRRGEDRAMACRQMAAPAEQPGRSCPGATGTRWRSAAAASISAPSPSLPSGV